MTEPTEKQKRQFNIWVEENPHKMKQLMDEYQENYVEEGDELENRNGFGLIYFLKKSQDINLIVGFVITTVKRSELTDEGRSAIHHHHYLLRHPHTLSNLTVRHCS